MIGSGPGRGTKRSVSCSPFATEFKAKRTATNLRRNNFACLFSVRKLTRAYNRVATEKAGTLSRCGGRERAAETAEREEGKERQRGQKREKGKRATFCANSVYTVEPRASPLVSFAGKSCRKITRSFMPQLSYRAIIKLASELPTYWSCSFR